MLRYGGLAILAVAALIVAGIALAQRTPERDALVAPVSPPMASATATAGTLKIRLPANPRLLIVGDSYTAGVGADRPDQSWAYLAARDLGYPFKVDGIGGTGFAWGGGAAGDRGREYSVRMREAKAARSFTPDLVVLQGGQNDSLAQNPVAVQAAVKQTVDTARQLWPGIQVVILGPSAPLPLAADLQGVNGDVRAGAAAAGVPFIDASAEGWFNASNSSAMNFDGSHVNAAGHRLIADKFLAAWATITS